MHDPAGWRLCFITGAGDRHESAGLTEEAILGGAQVIQLRMKDVPDEYLLAAGRDLIDICRHSARPLIINDRPDIALELGADGVHLGQEDMPADEARRFLGSDFIIGVSVACVDEAVRAENDGADYVAVGPVFATPIKETAKPVGLGVIASVSSKVDIPVMAIGGINRYNAAEVIDAGADGIAVISAISGADNPARAAADLLKTVSETYSLRRARH